MYVTLGRALAEEGVFSFRFDLSGIGESLAVGSAGSSLDRAANEIAAAMDYLQANFGIKKFVLFGLCSGADDAFYAAQQDDRIVGAVLLDGCGYRTMGYYWHRLVSHYLPRAFTFSKWANLLQRLLGKKASASTLALGEDVREFPDRATAASQLQSLIDRDLKLRFIYTGGVGEYFNHSAQFQAMFAGVAWSDSVSSSFHPQFDHVASLCEHRAMMIEEIVSWVVASWPQTASKPAPIVTTPLPATALAAPCVS
jgi:pimeloyl-ACP methyl ester carboxylesterase